MEIISNKFYNYMLLDPRKPFNWKYKENQIEYLPFYVGKGSKTRVTDHYRNSSRENPYTKKKLLKLKDGGFLPKYIVYNTNVTELEAFNEEIEAIAYIKEKFGNILTNATPGGENPPIRYGKDNNKSIPVYQYDLEGNYISEFECAKQAAESLGKSEYTHICACCKFQRNEAFKFIWRYFKQDKIEISNKKYSRVPFTKLVAYNDKEVHEFSSMKEAYQFLGVPNKGKINAVLKGERKIYKGYYWKAIYLIDNSKQLDE